MLIGVIGMGHLATAILAGLLRSGIRAHQLLLSPRGKGPVFAEKEGALLAVDNHDLVSRASVVLLAVRPDQATAAVAGLPWRQGQVLISACAGVALKDLPVAPAVAVRAMPLTASEINASPTACFPHHPVAADLLARNGPVIQLGSEKDFEVATVNAAVYGWAQDLIRITAKWGAAQGVDTATMRQLVAQTFVAAGRLVAEKPEPIEKLLDDLVTPGGITELGLDVLKNGGQPALWEDACAAVLARLTQRTPA